MSPNFAIGACDTLCQLCRTADFSVLIAFIAGATLVGLPALARLLYTFILRPTHLVFFRLYDRYMVPVLSRTGVVAPGPRPKSWFDTLTGRHGLPDVTDIDLGNLSE